MDKNGKLFGKISIIDIFVIILIIGVVAGTIYRFRAPGTNVTAGERKITYELKINGVREFTLENYKVGLKCYDKNTADYIGTIIDVRSEPYVELRYERDGTPYKIATPEVISIFLTIEAEEGRETDDAYYANGTYKLKIGSGVHLNTKYIDVSSIVSDIEGAMLKMLKLEE